MAKDEETQREIAVIDRTEAPLAVPVDRDDLLEQVMARYEVLDGDDLELRSALDVMTAATAEEVLSQPDSVSLRDICGEPFWLERVRGLLPSEIEEAAGKYYALYQCHDDAGRRFTATSGSPYVFFRAARLDQLGVLPRRVVSLLQQSKRNPNRWSLWIVDAPLRTSVPVAEVVEVDAQ